MKPLIGITCAFSNLEHKYNLSAYYVKAIEAVGGIPVMIPCLKEASDLKELMLYIDGLLLTGGGDMDPIYFDEEPAIGTGVVTPERDILEVEITRMAIDRCYPVLGICRGIQVINIVAGGKIHQDLNQGVEKPIKHMQEAPTWYPTHKIELEPNTKLSAILGEGPMRVNSFHHQSVSEVAPDYIVSARAADGVIEAIESTQEKFVMGVQWHPEHLWQENKAWQRLFQAFIAASK